MTKYNAMVEMQDGGQWRYVTMYIAAVEFQYDDRRWWEAEAVKYMEQ